MILDKIKTTIEGTMVNNILCVNDVVRFVNGEISVINSSDKDDTCYIVASVNIKKDDVYIIELQPILTNNQKGEL